VFSGSPLIEGENVNQPLFLFHSPGQKNSIPSQILRVVVLNLWRDRALRSEKLDGVGEGAKQPPAGTFKRRKQHQREGDIDRDRDGRFVLGIAYAFVLVLFK